MKKIIVALISVMLLFSSFSYAKGIAQQDAELLFGSNAKTMEVATIDKSEMAKTEGEWLPIAIFAARVVYSGWKSYRAYKQTRKIYRGYKAFRSGYRYAKKSRWEHLRLSRGGHSLRIKSNRGRVEFRAEIHPYRGFKNFPHFHARPGIKRHRPWWK